MEQTSDEIAEIAARGLHNPASLSLVEIRRVCGSALTQAHHLNPNTNPLPPQPAVADDDQLDLFDRDLFETS